MSLFDEVAADMDDDARNRLYGVEVVDPGVHTNVDTDEIHRGQLRMAYRLVSAYGGRLRYVHGVGWHAWDGTRWQPDLDGAATRAVVEVVTASYASLAGLDRDSERELLSDIHKCESANGVDGVLRLAGSLIPLATSYESLNADPYLFNCQSGTLDLRSGVPRPHNPSDLITKVAGCGYDPDARSETFDRFLTEIQPDPAMRSFIARVFGHALVGKVIEHKLPILTGVGQNGKSTLVDAVAAVFGDYAIAAEPELLVERAAAHTTGQADLLGVRLAVCSETDGGRRLAAATVKRLTGGDKIRARRMRQDNIEFAPSHTALMVTNHKPVVSGNDPALWRRLRIVPFDVTVPEPDLGLPERLSLELPAILAWIVAGYRDWQSHGLSEPEAVTSATDEYKASSDDLGRFIDESCLESPHMYVKARELFSVWSAWARDNGIDSGTEVAFAAVMAEKGFTKKRTNRGQTYQGISLAAQEEI